MNRIRITALGTKGKLVKKSLLLGTQRFVGKEGQRKRFVGLSATPKAALGPAPAIGSQVPQESLRNINLQ